VKRHLEKGDAACKPWVRDCRSGTEQQGVTAVQPWPREVDMFPAVGQVGHQRPKVDQPLLKRLIGTRAGFHPLQVHAGAFRRFVYRLHRKTGKANVCTYLNRRVVLEADAQRTLRDWGQPDLKVPKQQNDCSPSCDKTSTRSPHPAGNAEHARYPFADILQAHSAEIRRIGAVSA
jgi:hypothetical protein